MKIKLWLNTLVPLRFSAVKIKIMRYLKGKSCFKNIEVSVKSMRQYYTTKYFLYFKRNFFAVLIAFKWFLLPLYSVAFVINLSKNFFLYPLFSCFKTIFITLLNLFFTYQHTLCAPIVFKTQIRSINVLSIKRYGP